MYIHVVKPGENLDIIAKQYNLSINEIKRINPHFRSWEHLAPGARIRMPEIPEYVKDEIDEIDPFIEDYYPKINIEEILANNKESAEVTKEKEKESKKPQIKPNYYYYHPYYGYYNYYYQRKR